MKPTRNTLFEWLRNLANDLFLRQAPVVPASPRSSLTETVLRNLISDRGECCGRRVRAQDHIPDGSAWVVA